MKQFRCKIPLDAREAQYAVWRGGREEQSGEPAHGMADKMDGPGIEVPEDEVCDGRYHSHGYVSRSALCPPAAGSVESDDLPVGESGESGCVGIIFLGRAEAVQEQDRGSAAGSVQGGDPYVGALVPYRDLFAFQNDGCTTTKAASIFSNLISASLRVPIADLQHQR